MISLESEIMSNSYDPPGLLDGLGSGCRADAGPATSPSSIEGRGTASKDGGVKPIYSLCLLMGVNYFTALAPILAF